MTEIEKVKEQAETRAKLIAGTAHSLRTAMTNMRWAIEVLLDGDLGPLSAEQKDYLKKLSEQNNDAVRLLSEILNIIHAEEFEEREEKEEIDLASFAQKIINQFAGVAKKKGLTLDFKSEKLEPVTTESKKLEFILANLIDNALRYSNKGTVAVSIAKKDGVATFTVADEGIGIPAADQSRVFEKFYRAENAKTKEPMGTGLGLHIVRELTENLSGKIWFESKEGKGTTFYFTLPQKQ
jgi:two-component system phosphate regulon sensor histidine kinase PhoR